MCPREDSNLQTRDRSPTVYPVSLQEQRETSAVCALSSPLYSLYFHAFYFIPMRKLTRSLLGQKFQCLLLVFFDKDFDGSFDFFKEHPRGLFLFV